MTSSSNSKTAFVFGGGGSLGAVEVGMLKALTAHGVQADFVVGTSVGALNAAFFAGEPNANGVRRLEEIWCGIRRRDVFPFALTSLLALLGLRDHMVAPVALRRLIQRNLPYQRLEDARIPCHVVTTDVIGGIDADFDSGPAVELILASAAIPAVFPPVQLSDQHLVDGGITSNTPIATAVEFGATRLIVLPTGFTCAMDRPPRSALAVAVHAYNLLITRQVVLDAQRYAEVAELIVVPPLCPLAVSSYDFTHTGELIDRAAGQTERWIEEGGLKGGVLPRALLPHRHRPEEDREHEVRKSMIA